MLASLNRWLARTVALPGAYSQRRRLFLFNLDRDQDKHNLLTPSILTLLHSRIQAQMETLTIDPGALRRAYRDQTMTLSNIVLQRS